MSKRTPEKDSEKGLSLVAVGDICLAGIADEVLRVSDPFEFVRDDIGNSDISVGNLECVFSDKVKPITYKYKWGKRYGHKLGALPSALNYLEIFTVLSFANNHTLDFGIKGINDTIDALSRNGILTIGAGENYQKAIQPVIVESNSLRIGFISFEYSFLRDEIPLFSTWQKTHQLNRPGPARYFEKDVLHRIQKLKEKTDYIIASIHWGRSPRGALAFDYPSPPQRSLAERLIDHGVSIIFGHHPHVVQGVQKYRHGLIFYSLGNFMFDPILMPPRIGLMVRMSLSTGGALRYKLIPVDACSQPAKVAQRGSFLRYIHDISGPLSYSFPQYYEFWYRHVGEDYLNIWRGIGRLFLGPLSLLPYTEKLFANFILSMVKSKYAREVKS
ncbi:MAG: CapA family protein [Candidatus Hodarchaeota archaeon]